MAKAWTLKAALTAACAALAVASAAGAGVVGQPRAQGAIPDYDFDWAVISDVGNEPYDGRFDPLGSRHQATGRGGVDYVYRISKLEVTTAQWLEFVNAFAPRADEPTQFLRPGKWGGRATFTPGVYELNPFVPNAAFVPVKGLTWREAAMYANWLHNDKSLALSAIADGAYDTSTFGDIVNEFGTTLASTDQLTRHPDARFWIPTLDEWIKAAHYDPNRFGPGEGGWWQYSHSSDEPPIPGPPGEGQANTGFGLPGAAEFQIPLGSYPDVQSPWGLLDTAGAGSEWTEEAFDRFRLMTGTKVSDNGEGFLADAVFLFNGSIPSSVGGSPTIRIASAVPGPSGASAFTLTAAWAGLRRPRRRR